jgi:thioredoxin reductase (NADPH)
MKRTNPFGIQNLEFYCYNTRITYCCNVATSKEIPLKTDRDLIIVGGGVAGLSAAQYAARANLSVLLVEEMATGGQCLIIDRIENYPGIPDPISGFALSSLLEEQAINFGVEIRNASVHSITKDGALFSIYTDEGTISSLSVIVATGAKHKTLGTPGEKEFSGRGVSYCATCDGPFFKNKHILVVGGGDSACDEATYLTNFTDRVSMIHRRDRFRAQKALAERVLKNPRISVHFNTELREIKGDTKVNGVVLFDNQKKSAHEQQVDAVFIFIGSHPQTGMVRGINFDESGYIVTDERRETNIKGLFAAGDVRSSPFRQMVIAASDGAIAAHSASQHIDELRGEAYL